MLFRSDSDEDDEPAEVTGSNGVTGGADHKEPTDERKAAMDRAMEAKRLKKEGKPGEAKMAKRFGKEEDNMLSDDHSEEADHQMGIPKSKKDQLSGEYEGGVAEETGPSGVSTGYAEHKKNQNPYSKTGFGSTYKIGRAHV